jgi:hypothetical protein
MTPRWKTVRISAPLQCAAPLLTTVLVLAGCQTVPPSPGTAPGSASAASAPAPPASNSVGPRATIDRFLEFYFHAYRSGLPVAAERATLAALVTPEFSASLDGAARAERCAHDQHQGTEPPLLQGDLFSSLFEKANGILAITQTEDAGNAIEYALQFEYRLPDSATAETTWTDSVRLRLVDDEWLVDDFIHRGDWDFASKGSVRAMLDDIAQLCVDPSR